MTAAGRPTYYTTPSDALACQNPEHSKPGHRRFAETAPAATRWTPVEVWRGDEITDRYFATPVCDECDRWYYGATANDAVGNSVPIGDRIDFASDPRVLRYDPERTLAAFMTAIENMGNE